MPFKISKNYQNTYWINLGLSDQNSINWTCGISVIKDRFTSRFFTPITQIINEEFSGFIVMAVDCLLIETLMQFYLGVGDTEVKYRGEQWKAFKDFFKQSGYFQTDFKTDKICKTFYQQIRCGILHQAQTKQKSLIKICQQNFLDFSDKANVEKGLIIDRTQFHQRLVAEFDDYIQKLERNEVNFYGQNLRMNAIAKMKLICAE